MELNTELQYLAVQDTALREENKATGKPIYLVAKTLGKKTMMPHVQSVSFQNQVSTSPEELKSFCKGDLGPFILMSLYFVSICFKT